MLIYYIPPHANSTSKRSCKLIFGVKTVETHNNATMKEVMPVAMMVAETAVVAMQRFGGRIGLWALAIEW